MLTYKAQQVIAAVKNEPKPWEMGGRSGVSHSAKVAVLGQNAEVASITLKAKTAEDLDKKLAKYPLGKPSEIPIVEVVPVFRAGDRKPSAYELTA